MTTTVPSPRSRSFVGRMTRAMRAAAPTATKALRVGVVSGGRIVDERLLHGDGAIVVGASEECSLVIGGASAPRRLTLLERGPRGTTLRFTDAMRGRVVLPGGVTDLAGAAQLAKRDRSGAWVVALGEDARGSVCVGDATILFQLVAVAPRAPRPGLPLSVTPSFLATIDWPLATLAAISFLVHFGVVGTLYSDWADRILATEGDARGLVESLSQRQRPNLPVEDATPRDADPTREHAEPSKRETTARRDAPSKREDGHATLANEARRAFERMDAELRAIGAFDPSKVATRSTLDDASVPTGSLERLARSEGGSRSSPYGLRLDGERGPITGAPRSLADLGDAKHDGETMRSTGERTAIAAPKPTMTDGVAPPIGGTISGYDRVLRGARGRVRRCYETGLGSNVEMEGRLSYVLTVSASGAVAGVRVTPSGTLSSAVASCVEGALRGLVFDGPENGLSATITGSYGFVNSAKNR